MMKSTSDIKFPIVLFHDDGALVYSDEATASLSMESADVQQSHGRFGYGYDSAGIGVRLAVEIAESRFLGIRESREVVVLRVDRALRIEDDDDARRWLGEFIERRGASGTTALGGVDVRALLKVALELGPE